MSRIGNKPIPLSSGVKVDIHESKVVVTGPKGKLEREIRPEVLIKEEDGNLVLLQKMLHLILERNLKSQKEIGVRLFMTKNQCGWQAGWIILHKKENMFGLQILQV